MTLFGDRDERMLENLRILNSKFARKPRPTVARGERQTLTLYPGVLPPIVIAAFDTESILKPYANYVCTGVNDEATFLQAIRDMKLYDPSQTEPFRNSYGTILCLNGGYNFGNRLVFDSYGYGRLKIVGDGMPTFNMSYNTNGADGYCPMLSIPGGGQARNLPLIFENILFDGHSLSNAMCFLQRDLTLKPMIIVRYCYFTRWDNYLWHSERGSPRMVHDNQFTDCDFGNAAFHFEGFTTGPSLIHNNAFTSCTGDMVSGNDHAFHCLFSDNVQTQGTMTLNAKLGIEYTDNYGF